MQKWEFCQLGHVVSTEVGDRNRLFAEFVFGREFKPDGINAKEVYRGDLQNHDFRVRTPGQLIFAKEIAELGYSGWEMVDYHPSNPSVFDNGVGSFDVTVEAYTFKRPIEE